MFFKLIPNVSLGGIFIKLLAHLPDVKELIPCLLLFVALLFSQIFFMLDKYRNNVPTGTIVYKHVISVFTFYVWLIDAILVRGTIEPALFGCLGKRHCHAVVDSFIQWTQWEFVYVQGIVALLWLCKVNQRIVCGKTYTSLEWYLICSLMWLMVGKFFWKNNCIIDVCHLPCVEVSNVGIEYQ